MNSPTSSSLADDKACLLPSPQHGEGPDPGRAAWGRFPPQAAKRSAVADVSGNQVRLSLSRHRVQCVEEAGLDGLQPLEADGDRVEHTQDEALFDDPGGNASSAAPLALYRRYRPDTFAEVIGQDHVTEPLQRALTNNRVNHAYLFSGPRGCGKTTSARILARALNCEKGPRAVPCGECQSCRDLARNGPGSLDVIEIDAASHGGVDDARDLRERAFFAPVSSRFKIYIVDEAHMVTTAGFNALLKLVEEPPPHVKFVFATTEPDKVISTIRSRTHHYPFRLVPPRLLTEYLAKLCDAEGIAVEPAVLPLVVRAGGGSVRDSLSVLDQLLGGADESGVSYQQAAALLGYTPDSLLDEFVDAFAAGDAGGVFACVDKVIEVGQDPRRFAEDLLRRLRDLVIVAAVPDALTSGLVDVAPDQAERLSSQAAALGAGELTRAAEVIATGLTDMRGTTAPRLHLELMCARVLLPGADVDDRGLHARLDRLERRIGVTDSANPTAPVTPPTQAPPSTPTASATPPPAVPEITPSLPPQTPQPSPAGSEKQEARAPGLSVTDVRRLWPEVLEEVKGKRRFTWILLSQNAQVAEIRNGTLLLAMSNAGARDSFARGGNEDVLREAMVVVMGADFAVDTMVDPSATSSAGSPRTPPAADSPDAARPAPDVPRPRAANGVGVAAADDPDMAASRDDSDLEEDAGSHTELLARHLGAEIIAEEEHGA
jgi:DNA polymerase-3 subunit gamma/tau